MHQNTSIPKVIPGITSSVIEKNYPYFGIVFSFGQNKTILTRRRSESAYIRQVNFVQLLWRVGEGDGAPLKSLSQAVFKYNGPWRY